jgi:hypothetical protein
MKLDGPKMPLTEIAAILPALIVVLPGGSSIEGGTATAQFLSDRTARPPGDLLDRSASIRLVWRIMTSFQDEAAFAARGPSW